MRGSEQLLLCVLRQQNPVLHLQLPSLRWLSTEGLVPQVGSALPRPGRTSTRPHSPRSVVTMGPRWGPMPALLALPLSKSLPPPVPPLGVPSLQAPLLWLSLPCLRPPPPARVCLTHIVEGRIAPGRYVPHQPPVPPRMLRDPVVSVHPAAAAAWLRLCELPKVCRWLLWACDWRLTRAMQTLKGGSPTGFHPRACPSVPPVSSDSSPSAGC